MDVGEEMRVFFDIGYDAVGISRVAFNLDKYLPEDFIVTADTDSADLVVLHVKGRHDHILHGTRKLLAAGKQYAIIQYVLGSSRNPNPKDWEEIWNGAKVVWSYYDLRKYISNQYYAPLAADPEKFYKETANKDYLVGTIGQTYEAECLGEVRMAAYNVGGRVFNVGEEFAKDPNVDNFQFITDDEVRGLYNRCKHFSALRRKDGFEMVAIESLLCGVRPIMFDTPTYRHWFDGLVNFIPEDRPDKVVASLVKLFREEPRPVTDEEIEETKKRFNWKELCSGFWERCAK